MQILRIRRVHWLAAVRATYFENKQTANGETPMLDSDGEQIDILTQQLELVDHVDPVTTTGSIAGGVSNAGQDTTVGELYSRERTSSLAQTMGSDVALASAENDSLLSQNPQIANITNSSRMSFDSPTTSGRNTPTLADRQKRYIFRSDAATPPPSLTGSSSKHRSLT